MRFDPNTTAFPCQVVCISAADDSTRQLKEGNHYTALAMIEFDHGWELKLRWDGKTGWFFADRFALAPLPRPDTSQHYTQDTEAGMF